MQLAEVLHGAQQDLTQGGDGVCSRIVWPVHAVASITDQGVEHSLAGAPQGIALGCEAACQTLLHGHRVAYRAKSSKLLLRLCLDGDTSCCRLGGNLLGLRGAGRMPHVLRLRRWWECTLRCCLLGAIACCLSDVAAQHLNSGTDASELQLFCRAACRMVDVPLLLRNPEQLLLVLQVLFVNLHASQQCLLLVIQRVEHALMWQMCCFLVAQLPAGWCRSCVVEPFEERPVLLLPAKCDLLARPRLACQSQQLTLGSQQA